MRAAPHARRRARRRRLHRPAADLDRRILLASAVAGTPAESAQLAQRPLDLPRLPGQPVDDHLVVAFGRWSAEQAEPDAARGRLLLLVVDVEQRPLDQAADLLGLEEDRARALLTDARRRTGLSSLAATCRGWGLVSRQVRLTAAEQSAGAAHLDLCRRCRGRLADVERARRELLARTGGVAALVAAAEVAAVAGGGAAVVGGAGLLASKAAAGLVGVLGAAVVVGGSVAAVAQQSAASESTVVTSTTVSPSPQPPAAVEEPAADAGDVASVDPTAGTAGGSSPSPSPAAEAPAAPVLPLPEEGELPLPLPLPSPLPSPLPTSLPLPLPSPELTPLPLPSVSLSPLPTAPLPAASPLPSLEAPPLPSLLHGDPLLSPSALPSTTTLHVVLRLLER